ncbi:MAG: amino acid permease, partial [Raoultibacter sp.]
LMLFGEQTYQFFYMISAGMILLPYLLSAAYFAKLTFTEKEAFKGKVGGSIILWRILAIVGVLYSFFLAYASGPVGLTIMSLLYAPGILMYIKGKKERGEPYLKSTLDKVVVAIILIAAAVSVFMFVTGQVSL